MKSKINELLVQMMNLHPKFIDLSLKRLSLLLEKLDNPHLCLPKTIHIAGTNGKGSTLSFIKNILISNGYSCHAYISPHLTNFNERIILNNKEISNKQLYECLIKVKKINNSKPITFFEITTATAFLLFAKHNADFLILETGLGGRLDATNIIPDKELSIITAIGMDHEEFLGNSIYKITKEKLAITKNSINTVIAKQESNVQKFIKKKLKNKKNIYYYNKDFKNIKKNKSKFQFSFKNQKLLINKPTLRGEHQIDNATTAIASTIILKKNGYSINFNKFNLAIKKTSWPGRLEIVKYKNKIIILDGSHNVSGAKKLNSFLLKNEIKPIIVFGMLNNKNIFDFLKKIKNNVKEVVAIEIPDQKNSFKTRQILQNCLKLSINCKIKKSLVEANKYIIKSQNKYILFTGSLYLIGKVREKYL